MIHTTEQKMFAPLREKSDIMHSIFFEVEWINEQKADLSFLWRHVVVKKNLTM